MVNIVLFMFNIYLLTFSLRLKKKKVLVLPSKTGEDLFSMIFEDCSVFFFFYFGFWALLFNQGSEGQKNSFKIFQAFRASFIYDF